MNALEWTRPVWGGVALGVALSLGGCVGLSKDAGHAGVAADVAARLDKRVTWARSDGEQAGIRRAVAELLAQPLSADDAVQIALLNNRGLQALYGELGIAETDVVQAGRIANPRFSTTRTRSSESFKYETSLTFPILGLLTMPQALKMERRRFETVKLQVTDRILQLAAETRRAYVDAVAADASVHYLAQVQDAADAGAELAQRMAAKGNVPQLERLREQAFSADTGMQRVKAESAATAARERLTRLMGLGVDGASFQLPERLPDLPTEAAELKDLETFAMARRLDVAAAKRDVESTAASLGLTRTTRFINALEVGPATLLEHGEQSRKGYEISVELPLFDWGGSRVARAESMYRQAVDRVADVAVQARSDVRERYALYRDAWTIAKRYRDEIVPLRRRIADEHLLRYNGMLIGVFELLADAREQVAAANGYLRAVRDYWVAEADLRQALGGRLPAAPIVPLPSDAPAPVRPSSKG